MHTLLTLDTLNRIAIEHAALIGPVVGLVLLLVARQYLGRWPDLWRFRRRVLPLLADLGDREYEALDERVRGVDLEDVVPEKTEIPLQAEEFAGTIDAPPSVIRDELREMEQIYPNNLASIQYDVDEDGNPIYEVGSYAFREDGFLGEMQTHVRLTPADNGRQTRLWAHREYNAWAHPVRHYRAVNWSSAEGVHWVATLFASDDRFEASDRARQLVGEHGLIE